MTVEEEEEEEEAKVLYYNYSFKKISLPIQAWGYKFFFHGHLT